MPATQLKDEDVVGLLRKQHEKKIKDICSKHGIEYLYDDQAFQDSEKEENKPSKPEELEIEKLSPGLRLRHKDSGLDYDILSINMTTGQITLRNPEGKSFPIDASEVESDYELS